MAAGFSKNIGIYICDDDELPNIPQEQLKNIWEKARPVLSEHKGPVIIISTIKGSEFFRDLFVNYGNKD